MTSQNTMVRTNNMVRDEKLTSRELFESPPFGRRVKSMLKLDFYRLFNTPAFYMMLLIAAMIPALVLTMGGMETPETSNPNSVSVNASSPSVEITNAWQLIESTGGSAVADNPLDFAGFANINMLFIFAGLLLSIFVAHDYSSGYAKNIFTTHSKKIDYVISKSAIGMFGGACMIITYVFGTVLSGLLTGKSFDVNVAGLVMCLVSKTFLMGVFCSLFLSIAVFFRSKLWLTIVFTFLFGMMLYPAASVATLSSTGITVLLSIMAGVIGTIAFGTISTTFLKRRDLV